MEELSYTKFTGIRFLGEEEKNMTLVKWEGGAFQITGLELIWFGSEQI